MISLPLLPLVLDDIPAGLRQALAQEGLAVCDRSASPHAGRFVLYDSRRGPCATPSADQWPIDVHELRSGFPTDPFEALLDEDSARAQWQVGSVTISEEIARIDKRAVRRRVMTQLRGLVEAAGGVWVKLSAYPFPYRSAFNFRLDHDEFDADDFDATLRTIAGHEHAFSHYICGSTHEPHLEALARLRGSDVGSHGYWHHTYFEPRENLRNIGRGIETLRLAGIEPSGYVSPHGRFNRGLLAALEELGVGHSSEFGLSYDDLPFYPAGSRVLQIPVHPVCLGIFLEALRTSGKASLDATRAIDEASKYLCRAIEIRYQTGEPIFLYGHPDGRVGRYPQVLEAVLQTAAGCAALWMTDRTTLAAWWRARSQVRLQLVRGRETFTLQASELPQGQRLAIEYWRGEHVALMPVDEPTIRFSPSALAYQQRRPLELPRPVRLDGSAGLRGRMKRYLDWEKVTPPGEIDASTWRGWMKRTLRRVR